MDAVLIGALAGGIVIGALAAAMIGAAAWGKRLKLASERMARLEQARQQAEQHGARLASQADQMRLEIAELRHQAERTRRQAVAAKGAARVEEPEDLLFRNTAPPPQPAMDEQFPQTMILPRKPG